MCLDYALQVILRWVVLTTLSLYRFATTYQLVLRILGTPGAQANPQAKNGNGMAPKECSFTIGDPVWANAKGFSPWPGKIDIPPEFLKRPTLKKMMHCVFFFGTYDYGWIPEQDIKPYKEFKDKLSSSKKGVKRAIDEIEKYIAGGCKASSASIAAERAEARPTPKKTPDKKDSSKESTTDNEDADFEGKKLMMMFKKVMDEKMKLEIEKMKLEKKVKILEEFRDEIFRTSEELHKKMPQLKKFE